MLARSDTTNAVMLQPIDGFNYDIVQPGVAPELRACATSIRNRIIKTTQNIIDIGRELTAAKKHLDHGLFVGWVEAEVGIAYRTAAAYMAAARLADDKGATVAHLPPATVYRLASKSAPAAVVAEVVSRAKSGEIISDRAVVDMIAEVKHQERQADADERRRSVSKRAKRRREDRNRQHEVWKEEQQRRQQAVEQAASSLLQRFSADDIACIMETLDHGPMEVLEELRRLTDGSKPAP